MPKHIVKKHKHFESSYYIFFFIVLLFIIGLYLYDSPSFGFLKKQILQTNDIRELLILNDELNEKNKELDRELSKLKRIASVDTKTSISLQNEIKSLQAEVFNLRKELTFYKGIITASSYARGLNIQGLHIESTHDEKSFIYKLVLTNIGKSDSIAEVTVDMSLEGSDESGPRIISSDKMNFGQKVNRRIKIRNFERIEGSFNIPDGFDPLRVLVDLQQHDRSKSSIHRVFEWRTIVN